MSEAEKTATLRSYVNVLQGDPDEFDRALRNGLLTPLFNRTNPIVFRGVNFKLMLRLCSTVDQDLLGRLTNLQTMYVTSQPKKGGVEH